MSWKVNLEMAWTGSELGLVWEDSRDSSTACDPERDDDCIQEVYFNRVGFCE